MSLNVDDFGATFPPMSSTVRVEFGAHSRRGRCRSVNEDHYAIIQLSRYQQTLMTSLPEGSIPKRFDENGYAMIVADGMGGDGSGEAASRLALATLVQLVLHFSKWDLRVDDLIAREIIARAERFYRHVDATVASEAATGPMPNFQTTLTATFGSGGDLFFAHVGHSRAYLFRSGELLRLTRDHTIGRQRVSRVGLAPLVDVNLAARDLRHILTETIGMGGLTGPTIDLERFHLHDEDVIMVCTNGLTDALEEQAVADVLASGGSPANLSTRLVDLAMAADGEDDVTALIGQYHIPSPAV
jgi:serine/threonine protein phosphatase PrpC